jgi:septal ring factor EnvC (AmiA/AmiB activator)
MKALVGSWDNRPYKLLAEITALRTKVGQLEDALTAAREENDRLRAQILDNDVEVVAAGR